MCHERWALHVVIKRKIFLHLFQHHVYMHCSLVTFERFHYVLANNRHTRRNASALGSSICPSFEHLFSVMRYLGKTRCSAIAEKPRCRVCYSFRQKWKTGTGRQYFTDIIGLSSTAVI